MSSSNCPHRTFCSGINLIGTHYLECSRCHQGSLHRLYVCLNTSPCRYLCCYLCMCAMLCPSRHGHWAKEMIGDGGWECGNCRGSPPDGARWHCLECNFACCVTCKAKLDSLRMPPPKSRDRERDGATWERRIQVLGS